MKKKRLGAVLSGILLTALALTLTASAAWAWTAWYGQQELVDGPDGIALAEYPQRAAVKMISQANGSHVKYMSGDDQGLFQPERALTRGELAQILYGIVAERPAVYPVLSDVAEDAWYARPAATVVGLGLMLHDAGQFRPDDSATRAECAYALSQLLPADVFPADVFSDVWPGHWAYQAICRTAGSGLFYGDSQGNFRPGDSLKRCEAVTVFNRLLGRTPDLRTLAWQTDLAVFADVPRTHWAYAEIMEASLTHQYVDAGGGAESWIWVEEQKPVSVQPPAKEAAGLADGPHRIDGHLYWVVDETFARSCPITGLYFNENGWYTTGDEELDGMLNSIVDRLVDDSMTRDQKLRVLFDYVVKNYTYLARPLVAKGSTGWEPEYAKFFLKNGKGNCFSFSAAYCLLCREAGILAYTVVGTSGGSAHGWVEIYLDGNIYMFDPELQWYYNNKTTKKFDLFKMLPSRIPTGVYRYAW